MASSHTLPIANALGNFTFIALAILFSCYQELIIGEESIQQSTEPLQMIQLNSKGFPL